MIDLIRKVLASCGLEGVQVKLPLVNANFEIDTKDLDLSHQLWVDMSTRVVTRSMADNVGDDSAALKSVYIHSQEVRKSCREAGPKGHGFCLIAIDYINEALCPFLEKWHKMELSGAFSEQMVNVEFRDDLRVLQEECIKYQRAFLELSGCGAYVST